MRLPGSPRMALTASRRLMPSIELPSMPLIMSPGLRPARSAGVPSIGEITLIRPSSCVTWMPSPPNSPEVTISDSRSSSGLR